MHIFPTAEEVELASELLVNKYKVSPQLLGQLFEVKQRDQANYVLQSLGRKKLTSLDLARLLVQREGPTLFSGSQELTRELRLHLLQHLPDDQVKCMFERNPPTNQKIISTSHMRKPLAEKKWHSGKNWAKEFINALGFPPIFAGIAQGEEKVPTILDVPPRLAPPELADFQVGLKTRMLEVLERDGDKTRCVVTLPTGGGKTRVAVEAFIDWMQPRFEEGKYLLWIAQSEELCEQAITCIEQIWSSRDFVRPLRVYRYFGGRKIPGDDLIGGAVVASIQQLHNRVKLKEDVLDSILKDTGAMIIDEAHRAVSCMYDALLDKAEEICGPGLFPICGLTATPGRTGLNQAEETKKLVGRFETYLVKPELGCEYDENPLQYFRDKKYLAQAHHILFKSGIEYMLTEDEIDSMKETDDLSPGFLKRLAADKERNCLTIRRLLSLPRPTPTLVYACTVQHAYFLSVILNAQGRTAKAISSDTPVTLRRALIHDFKAGKVEFLCNYGVLTTGFDAPKTECIAICRPTTSDVLYEQIIGRGLRGPKFNGTEECMIIDFADNILRLGPPLAYARYGHLWSDERIEKA